MNNSAARYAGATLLLAVATSLAFAQPASQPTSAPTSRPTSLPVFDPIAIALGLAGDMRAGRFDHPHATFDRRAEDMLGPKKLGEVWQDLEKRYGPFESFDAPTRRKVQNMSVVIIPGKWKNESLDMQVTIDNDGQVCGLFFHPGRKKVKYQTPPYVDRNRFDERDIVVGSDPYKLPGRLSVPRESGKHPGVALVHGSGPNDRDETIGPNKPFRDLAWGLAARGIVVLRYDKRTKVQPIKVMAAGVTAENEVIEDAVLALKLLREQPEVDPKQTFILGHSLGGCLAPVIAKADGKLAGMMILSGTLRGLDEVLIEQLTYIAGQAAPGQDEARKALAQARDAVKLMREGKTKPSDTLLGAPIRYWQDVNAHVGETGAAALRAFSGRTLILGGGRDYQITRKDFDVWRNAAGDAKNVQLRWLPNMSHLFVSGQGMALPVEYEEPNHVDADVVEGLAKWIDGGDFPEPAAAPLPMSRPAKMDAAR